MKSKKATTSFCKGNKFSKKIGNRNHILNSIPLSNLLPILWIKYLSKRNLVKKPITNSLNLNSRINFNPNNLYNWSSKIQRHLHCSNIIYTPRKGQVSRNNNFSSSSLSSNNLKNLSNISNLSNLSNPNNPKNLKGRRSNSKTQLTFRLPH